MSLQKVLEQWKNKPLKELLIEMYIDKDMNIRDISKELCISVGVVHKYLKDFGINKEKKLWEDEI